MDDEGNRCWVAPNRRRQDIGAAAVLLVAEGDRVQPRSGTRGELQLQDGARAVREAAGATVDLAHVSPVPVGLLRELVEHRGVDVLVSVRLQPVLARYRHPGRVARPGFVEEEAQADAVERVGCIDGVND